MPLRYCQGWFVTLSGYLLHCTHYVARGEVLCGDCRVVRELALAGVATKVYAKYLRSAQKVLDYEDSGKLLGSLDEEIKLLRSQLADLVRRSEADDAGLGLVLAETTAKDGSKHKNRILPWETAIAQHTGKIRELESSRAAIIASLRDYDPGKEADKYNFNFGPPATDGITLEDIKKKSNESSVS